MTDLDALIKEGRELLGKATPGPWKFRAAKHSGGIKYVVAPLAPLNRNGTEFIPADCSRGFNGRFIAFARNNLARFLDEIEEQRELATRYAHENEEMPAFRVLNRALKERDALRAENALYKAVAEAAEARLDVWTKETYADLKEALIALQSFQAKR